MEAQVAQFLNRGMNQDISVSKASNEFAFENHNIRITAVNDNTLLSVTNEKGPKQLDVHIVKTGLINNKISYEAGYNSSIIFTSEYPVNKTLKIVVSYTVEDHDGNMVPSGERATYIYEGRSSAEIFINEDQGYSNIRIEGTNTDDIYAYYIEHFDEEPNYPEEIYTDIVGNYKGHAILNDYLILFTSRGSLSTDYIYRLEYKNDRIEGVIKYVGALGFYNVDSIETLHYYESEEVQKVYWVDGKHNPRFINITGNTILGVPNTCFDFSPIIGSYPKVNINKNYNGNGLFPAGVVQYFISYYNKFGTETGIVWSSDLHYISQYNRGEAADNNIVCSFTLNIENIDLDYDYLRIYSIIRTSENNISTAKIVADINISSNTEIVYTDTNTSGETIDPTILLFLGGSKFIASTLSQKDDTVFFGDVTIDNVILSSNIIKYIKEKINSYKSNSPFIEFGYKSITLDDNDFQLNKSSRVIKSFKGGDVYRFAIQFQDFTGAWTSPIWVGDKECGIYPIKDNDTINLPTARFIMDESLYELVKTQYSNYRVLMVESNFSNRRVLAQGIVTPTVFNYDERVKGTGPYSIASWIVRPVGGDAQHKHLGGLGNLVKYSEEKQKDIYYASSTAEIQNSIEYPPIIENLSNNFYVDNSIITLYSPDIENNQSLFNNVDLKFRIIGVVPINSSESDAIIETNTPGIKADAGFSKNFLKYHNPRNPESSNKDVFIKGGMYKDYMWSSEGRLDKSRTARYIVYMWNKKGSITGQTAEYTDSGGGPFNTTYADLKHKIIANKRVSNLNKYFNTYDSYNIKPVVFDSSNIESKLLKLHNGDSVVYQGNYENLLSNKINSNDEESTYRVFFTTVTNDYSSNSPSIRPPSMGSSSTFPRDSINYVDLPQYDPVHIKFNTTPHITFELNKNAINKSILPYMSSNGETPWSLENTYKEFEIPDNYNLAWLKEDESYIQESITGLNVNGLPYLFLGEVYREINDEDIFGGYEDGNMNNLSWIPISDSTPINENIDSTEGDTYYQRWDCLSSYPTTNEDINSVVDITSFMVETHINLDGRYDKSKEFSNLLNARRDNFNKINNIYSQSNNLFTYNILDEKFTADNAKNQVLFSLTKTPLSDIDSWTSIPATSAFNLNGLYGRLVKITNFNNTLITFQDKAISTIDFNNRTALSTEAGVPIEIANSGKVNGYSIVSSNIGCQNKHSICQTSSGIYFIDDLNKTLFRFNKEGINNVSSSGMSMWFKTHLTENERVYYDNITHDLYIVNSENCLLYNEDLQSFTSFMDYQKMKPLFNLSGHSFAMITPENRNDTIYKMFDGDYNTTFTPNEYKGYYVQYKINPDPLTDKVFTNIEYIAEGMDANYKVDEVYTDGSINPFTKLNVWTNFQEGETIIKNRYTYPNFERKFNLWRVDVPRSSNHRDRIRSPWMYLKLSSDITSNIEAVFHSLLVHYYR